MKLNCTALLLMAALAGCQGMRYSASGLRDAKLGMPLSAVESPRWAAGPLRDTVLAEGGYTWPARIAPAPGGQVLLEGDFFGADRLNRIRIESAAFARGTAPRTGSRWAVPADGRWSASWLEAYQVYDVVHRRQPQIHYLLRPDRPADGSAAAGTIIAIVLM
ncbi:MAG: hypothetical protein NW241_10690 [Bacteroidia bacterium]|nr:hypothetical protein [Bacteroidia bacterium]